MAPSVEQQRNLGARLRVLRELTGLTQEKFGRRFFDVGGATISRWELGKHTIQPRHHPELARLLGVAEGELYRLQKGAQSLRSVATSPDSSDEVSTLTRDQLRVTNLLLTELENGSPDQEKIEMIRSLGKSLDMDI